MRKVINIALKLSFTKDEKDKGWGSRYPTAPCSTHNIEHKRRTVTYLRCKLPGPFSTEGREIEF